MGNLIEQILAALDFFNIKSHEKIVGGTDSFVWKLETIAGKYFALRVQLKDREQQFKQENRVIQMVRKFDIPVPTIQFVETKDEYVIMLMDWVRGRTVLEALNINPVHVNKLGYEFGRVQASINKIPVSDTKLSNWISPTNSKECEVYREITEQFPGRNNLLHLDFHPLNVLTDGERITGVIDWANASVGDYRFCVARTLNILETEAPKYVDSLTLHHFVSGWKQGYECTQGIGDLSLFNSWASIQKERDRN